MGKRKGCEFFLVGGDGGEGEVRFLMFRQGLTRFRRLATFLCTRFLRVDLNGGFRV